MGLITVGIILLGDEGMYVWVKNSKNPISNHVNPDLTGGKSRKRKKVLTGDSELNLFGDDGSNAVFGIASIVSRVRSAD